MKTNKNLYLRDQGVIRHEMVMGASGFGKSTYIKHRVRQQIARGAGLHIVDAKLDYEFRDWLYSTAKTYHREHHLRVVNIDDASSSHTYNPLQRGDAETVASRIMNVVDTQGSSTGEHFKSQQHMAVMATIAPLLEMNVGYNMMDLFILLSNPQAMQWLLQHTPSGEARTRYEIFLQNFRSGKGDGVGLSLDMDRIRSQIGGIAGRIYPYAVGDTGKVMGSYNPEVDIIDGIDNNHITYFMLPSLAKNESSMAFAHMFLSDFRSALAVLYKRRKEDLPPDPHEVYMDEFGSYAITAISQVFEMARGANIALSPSFQTHANLTRLGKEFATQVTENCSTKTFLHLGGFESEEIAAMMIGEELQEFQSHSQSTSRSAGNTNLDVELFHSVSESSSASVSTSKKYGYRVRPEIFGSLPIGEAIIVSGAKPTNDDADAGHQRLVHHVEFPIAEPKGMEPFRLIRYTPRGAQSRPGLNLEKLFETTFSIFQR